MESHGPLRLLLIDNHLLTAITQYSCAWLLLPLDRLYVVDFDTLAWWLSAAERQLPSGGLNGRPKKLEDLSPFLYVMFVP